jgi:myo-inositol-1(or 4)-monophosphatase
LPALERDQADLALLIEAAREAGALLRARFGTRTKIWDKGGSPVTEADLEANEALKARLTAARPAYAWMSEESHDGEERLAAGAVFVVDPLDGTVAFIKGREDFSVSLAVVRDGRPVAGVVYAPVPDRLYAAALGGGATRDGKAVQVSDRRELEGARMIGPKDMFLHPAWPRKWPPMEITRIGSVALRLAMVAGGEADGTLALSQKSDWDMAAGDLIAREAGAAVTTHDGGALIYNRPATAHPSLMAAGPGLYPALFERTGSIRLPAGNRNSRPEP